MKKIVDARGLSCPQPVVLTKRALENQEIKEITAIVDNQVALENISRMLKTLKLTSVVDERGGDYYINILKEDEIGEQTTVGNWKGNTVILVTSNVLGQGDDKLGAVLIKSFFYTLTQMEERIESIIFMNSGVLLTTAGSDVLEHIQVLESNGIEILSCGTCLDFFGIKEKLQVGIVSNMYSISEKILNAGKVISL